MRKELKHLISQQIRDLNTKTERHFIIPAQPKNAKLSVTNIDKIIIWLKIGNFTYKEIAQVLRITEVKARTTVHRIKRKLGINTNLFCNILKHK
jgi:DNA-binding CsgD family transcriptional regulator